VLRSVWANPEISLPNAIPTMSEATGLIYSIGARDGIWTLEAVDWDTGDSAFFLEIGDLARHNSAFAATQVGPDGGPSTTAPFSDCSASGLDLRPASTGPLDAALADHFDRLPQIPRA